MTDPGVPSSVIAAVTGKDLLERLDSLTREFTHLAAKLDDIPSAVHDHETRLRHLEAAKVVTWSHAAAAATLFILLMGALAAWVAIGHR
jgi:hypothetical protein